MDRLLGKKEDNANNSSSVGAKERRSRRHAEFEDSIHFLAHHGP